MIANFLLRLIPAINGLRDILPQNHRIQGYLIQNRYLLGNTWFTLPNLLWLLIWWSFEDTKKQVRQNSANHIFFVLYLPVPGYCAVPWWIPNSAQNYDMYVCILFRHHLATNMTVVPSMTIGNHWAICRKYHIPPPLVTTDHNCTYRKLGPPGFNCWLSLLQCSSGVVRHPRDLQVSVAKCFCRVLVFVSS